MGFWGEDSQNPRAGKGGVSRVRFGNRLPLGLERGATWDRENRIDSGPSSAPGELCVPGASQPFALGLGGPVPLLICRFTNDHSCSAPERLWNVCQLAERVGQLASSSSSCRFSCFCKDEDEDSEDSEDDEDWDTGSTSSDSDSEEEEGKQTVLASRFLKK